MIDRTAVMIEIPILSGFLATLLQDADRARDDDNTIWDCPDETFQIAAGIFRGFLAAPGICEILDDLAGDHWRLPSNRGDEAVGGDLYLTCNGHGAGFWDGDWEPHGEALTDAAHGAARYLDSYVGDDGRVYIAGGAA